MSTILNLEIPDQIYQPLLEKANKRGKPVNQILIEYLGEAIKDEPEDPLLQLAGAFSSESEDIGTNHDFYIGQELRRTHE